MCFDEFLWPVELGEYDFHDKTLKLCDFPQNHQLLKDMSEEKKRQLYLVLETGGRYSGKWGNMWPLWLNAWNGKTEIHVIRYWILRNGYLVGIVH